jgi:hypothetical protein
MSKFEKKRKKGHFNDFSAQLPETSHLSSHLKFSFTYLTEDNNYSLDSCTNDEKISLITKLAHYSKMTINQIRNNSKHKAGVEFLSIKFVKDTIPLRFSSDHTDVAILRFSAMKPMVGFLERDIFYVIWLDRNFTLYKHQ